MNRDESASAAVFKIRGSVSVKLSRSSGESFKEDGGVAASVDARRPRTAVTTELNFEKMFAAGNILNYK